MRSKHCSTLKKCVPMFDHYCPYIGNTIGGVTFVAVLNYSQFAAHEDLDRVAVRVAEFKFASFSPIHS